jgi:homoserine O-succinyltransferase/O-acetyltransferase
MPLVINGGDVPEHWAEQLQSSRSHITAESRSPESGCVRIALINNMPDAALEDTEAQFFSLLDSAAGEIPVQVQLYHLPEVPREERVQDHLSRFYLPVDDLWNTRLDGAIITGTEPRQRDLRDEPYWQTLAKVFDWAEEQTTSTVLSCLAAHASVLHSDSIERHLLGDKQFGVFEYARIGDHELTDGLPRLVRFPHSRWNEVQAEKLVLHGYTLLDGSTDAGVNFFIKKKGQSLFVHFQGHPEYGAQTLFKEYRRDIRRFLKLERATYPSMPHGYFDGVAGKFLSEFRQRAENVRSEETLTNFPEARLIDTLKSTWHASASRIYRNWLKYMISKKAAALPLNSLAPAVRA